MRKIKLFSLLFLILLIPPVSAYDNIAILGPYGAALNVNIHLGDDTDNDLSPPEATGISYTHTFSMYGEPKRQEVRLLLTTVNVQPSGGKDEREYNDLVYVNGVIVGRLNDKTGTAKQDYSPQQMEMIFSSDLLREGENSLMITSGSNLDGTNYDDFSISIIYLEQYGKVRHWLFSYVAPEIVVLVLVIIMVVLAVYGYRVHKRRRLSENYQLLLVGGLGAIMGMILIINIQDNLIGFLVLLCLVGGIAFMLIGFAGMAVAKYLFHRGIMPAHFLFLLRPLVFLVLALIFMFISYQYLYFDPGGPKPTYGVPVHRPEKE
jgi:hypothetical protein